MTEGKHLNNYFVLFTFKTTMTLPIGHNTALK